MWKYLTKSRFGEPTSFFDHKNLGCTQRHCETRKHMVDKCRTLVGSRISAGATEKLPSCERDSTCPHFCTRLHRRDTSLTTRNATRTELALWHTITLDCVPHGSVPAGHRRYTRAWYASEAVGGSTADAYKMTETDPFRTSSENPNVFLRGPTAWKVVPRRARKRLSNGRTKPLNNSSKSQLRALMTIS